ncbi:hypothetical protein B0H13DRAFT_2330822 [Mycena leptocephala]|nr:hypothetical protein B0H13DRAFT_2330822 [Mycena leptocephala]
MLSGLEADRVRVAELEAKILDLERAVVALRIEQAIAREHLDLYRYPVLTLPNEIISEIFMHFLPAYSGLPPLTGILSPTLLTHICCKWREIALGTPSLWKAIELTTENHIHLEQQVNIAGMWLNRSRCCPVSLRLDFIGATVDLSQVFATVVPHRARLERLTLYLSPSYLPTIEGPMPLLRQLDVVVDHTASVVVTFRELPLLRTVILSGPATLCVIAQTPNLVRCVLEVCFEPDDHQLPGPDIALLRLESFELSFDDPPDDLETSYLETFIFPALINLKIAARLLGSNPIDSLTSFISKSGCKLQEVRIIGETSVAEGSYLEAFPTIQIFFFTDDEDSEVDNS